MEKRPYKDLYSSVNLKPSHIQSRRKVLSLIPSEVLSNSPKKKVSNNSNRLIVSNSSNNFKYYKPDKINLLYPATNRHIEKLSPIKHKKVLNTYNSTSTPELIPKTISNIYVKSITGMSNGKAKKNNQDSLFVLNNFCTSNQVFLGVMDGHGLFGSQVSNFVKTCLPGHVENLLNTKLRTSSYPFSLEELKVIENVFIESFTLTQNDIKRRQDIDISFSGTTAVSVLVRGNQCICSNCGDSRAIIGSFTRNGWVSVALSKDHKPENAEEKERIKKSNGRVEPFKNAQGSFVGPMRVWLKNDDIPGLAMSRSIGDLVASQAGVISKPDVFVHTLRPSDKFIVIASDGIWEFISSEECVNIISTFYFSSKLSQACDHIADLAVSRWNKEDASVDDITIIIVSLSVKESIILKNV